MTTISSFRIHSQSTTQGPKLGADIAPQTYMTQEPILQPQELGRLFQKDISTPNLVEEHPFEPKISTHDDPILGVHVEQVHSSVPRIVHPDMRPIIVTTNTNVAEIVSPPNTLASTPECPRAPPPSPYNTTFGRSIHEAMDDFSDEEVCCVTRCY